MRVELNKLKEEEKQAELAKLTELKEDEIRNLKAIWQAKTNELLDEVFNKQNTTQPFQIFLSLI